MKRSLLSVSLLLCVACSALAQDKITLKLKYLPGTYVTTMKTSQEQQITGPQKITQTVSMTMVMEMTVDKASDNGQQIHVTYKRIAQAIKGGPVEMAYDSADKKGGDEKNPMAILGNMVDAAIDVTLDADGKVTKVKGMNEIFDKMAKDNPMMGDQMKKSMGDKTVTEMFDGARRNLPDKPVAVGDKWECTQKVDSPMGGAMDIKTVYTLKKIESADGHKVAIIDVAGGTSVKDAGDKKPDDDATKPKLDIQQTGTMKVNVETGQATESNIDQDMSMDMKVGDTTMSVKSKGKINMTTKEGKYEAAKE